MTGPPPSTARPFLPLTAVTVLAAAGLYLLGNGAVSLWDRDEPRYAQTSRQMLRGGDWVVPRLYDEVRTAKPVFVYWCQAASMKLLGENAFAARLPSAVAMTAVLVVLAVALWRGADPARAAWAVFILATSALVVMSAKMCTTDAVLLLWVTVAQLCLYAVWRGRATWPVVVTMALAVGLAGLTKGPVVLGVMGTTALALGLLRAFDAWRDRRAGVAVSAATAVRRPRALGPAAVKCLVALMIVAAVAGPWLYLVHRRESQFLGASVSHDVLRRVVQPLEGHKGPPGYHLAFVFATFLPWSLLLPLAVVTGWKYRRLDPRVRFALAAVIGPWVMFEIVRTKLPHYLLPVFPALAYLAADAVVRGLRREHDALTSRPFVAAAGVWAVIIGALGLVPWLAPLMSATGFGPQPWAAMVLLSLAAAGYAVLVWLGFHDRKPIRALVTTGGGFAVVLALLFGLYLPRAHFMRVSVRVAEVLRREGATGPGQVVMIDYKEPSLAFYQGGTIRENHKNVLTHELLDRTPPWLVITRRVWDAAPPDVRGRLVVVEPTVHGWAYADGREVEVMVVRKRAPRYTGRDMPEPTPREPTKVLVVQPNWVGDAVMATPALRALRELYPRAHISYLMRRYVKPLYVGMPWVDQLITYRTGKTKAKAGKGQFFDLAARLRAGRFDLAVLLPNSFRSALVCKMAGIPRVVGYERDARGFLLSDKLLPVKDRGKFVPSPIVKSYLGIAHYLGSDYRDVRMQLFVTPGEAREARAVFARCGLDPELHRPAASGGPPLVLLNPGAAFGAAKCWKAEYFAELADKLVDELNATVLLSAAPKERPIVKSIKRQMRHAPVDLSNKGMTLGSLKEIVRRCDLMVTNDTGPRHVAAAMDVPVVTIFGPTHPEWTEIYYAKERQVAVKVFCGPCQKKTCPLDHRCMTRVTPGMVYEKAMELLAPTRQQPGGGAGAVTPLPVVT